jgi:hypothetical protein
MFFHEICRVLKKKLKKNVIKFKAQINLKIMILMDILPTISSLKIGTKQKKSFAG